ncbi:MAG: hypothetical protein ACKPGT_26325, partial [Microcystis sp.]
MATSKEIKELRKNLTEEAKQIMGWAESTNLLRLGQPILELERRGDFPAMFSGGESALVRKPITAIGINPYKNSEQGGTIFVYTQTMLTRPNQDALAETYQGKSHLEFKVLKSFRAAPGAAPVGAVQTPRRIKGYIPCGSSISLAVMRDAGTLGSLVWVNDKLYGLSANHVTGGCSNAPVGSPILFPGILDVAPGVEDPLTIGHHYSGLIMSPGNPQPQISAHSPQNLDAAIFSIRDPDTITSLQGDFYDTPTQVETDLELEDLDVEKVGRTTGHTTGFIESLIVGYQPLSYKLKIFVSASEQIPFEGIVYYKPTYLIRVLDKLACSKQCPQTGSAHW